MQRRSKRLRLQRMVESTPKAGKSSIALPTRNQPQRLVRSAHPTTQWWVVGASEWIMSAIVFVDSVCESPLSIRGGLGWVNATAEQEALHTKDGGIEPQRLVRSLQEINPKGWCAVRNRTLQRGGSKRMDNERDSLCAFRLRIATFDSGWANAAAEQEALHTMDGGINPKGW